MEWLNQNWGELMAAVLLALRLAESIVEMTPSQRDNEIVGKIGVVIRNFFRVSPPK